MPCGKSYIFFIFSQVNQNQNSRAYSLTNLCLWIAFFIYFYNLFFLFGFLFCLLDDLVLHENNLLVLPFEMLTHQVRDLKLL